MVLVCCIFSIYNEMQHPKLCSKPLVSDTQRCNGHVLHSFFMLRVCIYIGAIYIPCACFLARIHVLSFQTFPRPPSFYRYLPIVSPHQFPTAFPAVFPTFSPSFYHFSFFFLFPLFSSFFLTFFLAPFLIFFLGDGQEPGVDPRSSARTCGKAAASGPPRRGGEGSPGNQLRVPQGYR